MSGMCRLVGHKVDRPDIWIGKRRTTVCPRCHLTVDGYPAGTFKRYLSLIRGRPR